MPKAKKKPVSKPEKFLFQLDGISLLDLKRASLKRDSGNVSHMINQSLKWYIHCLTAQDKGLERFLAERLREEEAELEM